MLKDPKTLKVKNSSAPLHLYPKENSSTNG